MRRLGYKLEQIATFTGKTVSSVHYTCKQGTADVLHKQAGRKAQFPAEKVDAMIKYVEEYLAKERAAGVDRKTGKKKVQPLTYEMIRDALFKDENGNILEDCKKITEDAMKRRLNSRGLWLRMPMSEARKENMRIRGKKQWSTLR